MERSKTENLSAFAQAIKRRDGVMRAMLGMGPDPVGQADGDKHDVPQAVIWRVAGRRDRSRAGCSRRSTSPAGSIVALAIVFCKTQRDPVTEALVGKKSPRRRAVNRGRDDGWLKPSAYVGQPVVTFD
jgi:hypothetical protein